MKVILYTDVKHVGEMGDVKNVAAGYARNYLFPRSLAVPYNAETVAYFESKKEEIEARKAQKREESKSLKEKLEALTIELTMPAGNNGKLYGAVTNLTIANWFDANGYEIERKKIEIPGATFKQVGKYTFKVHLYETTVAEVNLTIVAQKTDDTADEAKASKKEAKKEEAPVAEETKSE